MQPRKPKRIFLRKRPNAPTKQRNLTFRMLEELRNQSMASSDIEPLRAKDKATLSGISERLLKQGSPWTPADYVNVQKIYRKCFGRTAKPE